MNVLQYIQDEKGNISIVQKVNIAIQIAKAIRAIHTVGFFFNDLDLTHFAITTTPPVESAQRTSPKNSNQLLGNQKVSWNKLKSLSFPFNIIFIKNRF